MAFRQLALVLFVVILTAASAGAQQDAATVAGEVTDASGGVVPGATVTVTNVATGIALTTDTNERRSVHACPAFGRATTRS